MSYYRLAPSVRSNSIVDRVIYGRDPETGEQLSVSVTGAPSDISDSDAGKLRDQGYALVEVPAPEDQEGSQVVGDDVAGMSPVVGMTAAGETTVDQQAQQKIESGKSAPSAGSH